LICAGCHLLPSFIHYIPAIYFTAYLPATVLM
jgi:hypothetical protein